MFKLRLELAVSHDERIDVHPGEDFASVVDRDHLNLPAVLHQDAADSLAGRRSGLQHRLRTRGSTNRCDQPDSPLGGAA
jgi:hypothetical protein